jgi:signal transduction histidine kinase/ActR/RegA family two-component response regulator
MIDGGAAESRKRRLDFGCALADALFERSELGPPSCERRALAASRLLEESELPTAVLDAAHRTPRLVNAAWRALFGTRDAYAAIPGLADPEPTGDPCHVAELAHDLDGPPAYVAATWMRGATGSDVIVCCIDITDEVIARKLGVDGDALVWSGLPGRAADHFNRRWSSYAGDRASWRDAIHVDDVARCTKSLAWAVHEGGSTELEARVRRADDSYRWHRIRLSSARSGSRWFGAATDIHEARVGAAERNELLALERAARSGAEEANRLKDQFIATVSHELRTPLTTMVLWEAILRDDTAEPELRTRALDAIRQSVMVQSRVVGDLLDISRAISGKLYVDLRPVEIGRVVRGALDTIAPTASAKQITVECRGADAGGEVSGDAVRLLQVLDNLLSNAVKVTEPGGRITVTVSRPGRSIVISIEDTGRGIAAELLSRLFEPFSQSADTSTRAEGGLGLGLVISRRLVELHGGTLVASSKGPGQGATLTIAMPAITSRGATAQPTLRTPDLDRTRVLVIDDDRRVREALSLLLHRAGADVETADSAEAGRVRIGLRTPEAVVCDIAMPGEDGYSFIRELRASGSDVAAIALTAHATASDVERALAAGFDRHLAKPIDFESLVVSLDELIVARRALAPPP